jgi:tripartite ATP-independent transporter DctM subunit
MFASLAVLILTGFPMGFSLATIAILFTIVVWGPQRLPLIVLKVFNIWGTVVLVAIPLFVYMGALLERSGIADDLFKLVQGTIGRIRGGLAMGTVLICTIFAAMTGISAAATVSMGLIALPAMLKRGYSKQLSMGAIAGGGALGILIPPSITMIVYAVFASESTGRLFAGGILPGLLLSTLFIIYIGIRSSLQPDLAPRVEPGEVFSFKQMLVALKGLIFPLLIIIAVLGSIFSGIATPTEAASVGALGSFVCAVLGGKFKINEFKESLYTAFRLNAMIFWILIGGSLFSSVYIAMGGQDFVKDIMLALPVNRWVIIIMMQAILFFLGCFMSPTGIIMVTTPVFVPVVVALGFDPVWFGILFIMNMEMAYLTPPFGGNLFYLKGVVPPGITMLDIYKSVGPFVALQAVGLAIVMVFPQIATFLPDLFFTPKL